MRYKLTTLAMVLLISTPIFAQEMSPIVIFTGQPTPSAVRSGEQFKITYRAEFYDKVLIKTDQMQPENVSGVVTPFEAIKLEIFSLPDMGDNSKGIIHVQDFVYTFMIINPEKGDKKIPSFNFVWIDKEAGTSENIAKEENKEELMPTEPVGVRYVSTPVKPPPLNIRDEINYPAFKWNGATLRRWAYGSIVSSFFLALAFAGLWARFGKAKRLVLSEKKSKEAIEGGLTVEVVSSVFPKMAKKRFIKELKKLLKDSVLEPSLELETTVHKLLREFILVELKEDPVRSLVSDSPRDLSKRLSNLSEDKKSKMGSKYPILILLTKTLEGYYSDMESVQTAHFVNPRSEIRNIISIVRGPTFLKRLEEFFLEGLESLGAPHV